MRTYLLLAASLVLAAAACGSDAPPPPPNKGGPAAGKPGAAKQTQKPKALAPRMHVEERVSCPEIEKPTGPQCNPAAPSCELGLYCQPVKKGGTFCEPCPERFSIRHEFKDRDFVADQVRDPFQSFITPMKGMEPVNEKKQEGPCNRPEQFVATAYSYLDLKLVGIVAQGTRRRALMTDRLNYGWFVSRGDCVGKEKAVVKDIGPGFVTFVVRPDENDKNPNRAPEERSVQLHPKGLQVAPEAPPEAMQNAPSAPIVAPPNPSSGTQVVPPPSP